MKIKELFNAILSDPELKKKIDLSDKKIENIEISSSPDIDHIQILKTILYDQKNGQPDSTIYKKIRKYFGINWYDYYSRFNIIPKFL